MNIIVSTNSIVYTDDFFKVTSLKEACTIVGSIDFLIYNNSQDTQEETLKYLGQLKERTTKLVYICSEKKADMAIKMMIIGSGGNYFDDEFFLESSQELISLINSIGEITDLVDMGSVNVLSDFLGRYLSQGDTGKPYSKAYLTVVKGAVEELICERNNKNMEILQMAETASDIFSQTSSLLSSMREEQESLKSAMTRIAEKAKSSSTPVRRGTMITYFPIVNYLVSKKIISIKDLCNSPFLTSFILGARHYYSVVKHIRTKLIVCLPQGELLESRYSKFKWVTTSTIRDMTNYYADIVFTNCPSKEVLTTLLDDNNYELFIVLDRTISYGKHVLKSKNPVRYAISGQGNVNSCKLKKSDCFSSIYEIADTMFTIPFYTDYPLKRKDRESFYITNCKTQYDILSKGVL